MTFSEELLQKAIRSSDISGLAWKKEDIFQAIDEVTASGYAILGGDVWVVKEKNPNNQQQTLIDSANIAFGIIKGNNGKDQIYNWYTNKNENESWDEYINRSKLGTIQAINQMNVEESISKELQDHVYYCLTFVSKTQYEDLGKNKLDRVTSF